MDEKISPHENEFAFWKPEPAMHKDLHHSHEKRFTTKEPMVEWKQSAPRQDDKLV